MSLRPAWSCAQNSVKAKADMRSQLGETDFKWNESWYWVTSIEAPDNLWLQQLKGTDTAVQEFDGRREYNHPHGWTKDFGESKLHWLAAWTNGTLVGPLATCARVPARVARAQLSL